MRVSQTFYWLTLLCILSCEAKSTYRVTVVNSTAGRSSEGGVKRQQQVLRKSLRIQAPLNKNNANETTEEVVGTEQETVISPAESQRVSFKPERIYYLPRNRESAKDEAFNQPEESQQVSVVATHELMASPGGHGHGGHSKSFSKKSGHKSGHHKDGGGKGGKDFHSDKGHKSSHDGHFGKKGAKGHFSKGGKHHKGHHHSSHHQGGHKAGKKASKGHKHGKKGHHHKGNHKKGFKNSYSKSESGKSSKFYTDSDFKKYGGDHDHFHKFFDAHKGGHHKGGSHSGGKHHDHSGKKGSFKKGGHHDKHSGHKSSHGKHGHSAHKSSHGNKGGHKSTKGSSHKSKGKHRR